MRIADRAFEEVVYAGSIKESRAIAAEIIKAVEEGLRLAEETEKEVTR